MGGFNTGKHAQNSLMSISSPVPLPLESITQNGSHGSFCVQIQDTLHNQVITIEFKDGMQVMQASSVAFNLSTPAALNSVANATCQGTPNGEPLLSARITLLPTEQQKDLMKQQLTFLSE
jgi:hypothetical protein